MVFWANSFSLLIPVPSARATGQAGFFGSSFFFPFPASVGAYAPVGRKGKRESVCDGGSVFFGAIQQM